ncbi:Clavaminate synthase-like protein [Aspergillus steynii IBT 23096]|uniref:Clavaminate synthase-like protein n=1 Tax=Aspergillus steynii IBT 23096 TaxID=1392250 RepID=A0A2I2GM07_9EURO|nr:Clavaminate synthase-like protein [Aspergillus steynii IBT 23096]PLB53903.1 Clavaminate synthase-like protein [Aspergillus steynii IBT 23096]
MSFTPTKPRSELPEYTPPAPTSQELDWIQLVNIDLAKYDNLSTRQELARELLTAVTEHGFLTISNHGISPELYRSQVNLANAVMTLPPDEKQPFEATPEEDARGRYVGFKPSGELGIKGGFHKSLDHYNILVHDPENHPHPPILEEYKDEANYVMHFIRNNILRKLLVLMSMILEVPEERVLETHSLGKESTEYLRYMIYNPRTEEDNTRYRDLYLAGHTDWGTFTFLFSQPISALQILDNNGNWKWVQYLPDCLVVNVGEALELLTGGLFKATIHRVVKPPVDQEKAKRIGVIYFSRPDDEQMLRPIESPLLKRLGIDKPLDETVYNMADYLNARKHGYKRLDFDNDRPRQDGYHADPFHGVYPDPEGFKALGVQKGVKV